MKYALIALLLSTQPVLAHSWYDPWCCNEKDCAPIPNESVTATDNGWYVVLEPGDHPLVTKRQEFVVPYFTRDKGRFQQKARKSKDHQFHACLYPNEDNMRCFYEPDFSY